MLKGYKTYITGIVTIVSTVGAFLLGEITLTVALPTVVTAVMGMTIRAGVTTEVGKKLVLGFLCIGIMLAAMPQKAHAGTPLFLFASTIITGGWFAATSEDCKDLGLDGKECVTKLWSERIAPDYSKLND